MNFFLKINSLGAKARRDAQRFRKISFFTVRKFLHLIEVITVFECCLVAIKASGSNNKIVACFRKTKINLVKDVLRMFHQTSFFAFEKDEKLTAFTF